MSGHTPGPWTASGTKALGLSEVIAPNAGFSDGHLVCMIGKRYWEQGTIEKQLPRGQVEANARLIAAAPDLLAACKALPDFDTEAPDAAEFVDHAADFVRAMELARAAIRKAEAE